jgi:hypothetical protein
MDELIVLLSWRRVVFLCFCEANRIISIFAGDKVCTHRDIIEHSFPDRTDYTYDSMVDFPPPTFAMMQKFVSIEVSCIDLEKNKNKQ